MSLGVPEQICELPILPPLARFSRPIFDEINCRDVRQIVLNCLIQKSERFDTVCVCVNWPLDQVREHTKFLIDGVDGERPFRKMNELSGLAGELVYAFSVRSIK